jgi:hypothetical protein
MPAAVAPSSVLRVAASWGTTIVGMKLLQPGQDCILGDSPEALSTLPDGSPASSSPLRAVSSGWELDARGAVSGVLMLRGREENVSAFAGQGAPVPVVPGDFALLRGPLGDPLSALSFFSSIVFHLGLIGLLIVNWTPPEYQLPPELVSPEDYAERFGLKRVLPEMEPPSASQKDDKGGGQGVKDPGAKDPRKQGGGQKIAGKEGKAGMNGKEDHTELTGEIKPTTNYGGLSEALADTGTEIKKTLNTIQTVADALGGLNSNNVVLGAGSGTGLKGAGAGGGGTGAGVMFGSGTLDTGWGPGSGGGFGSGAGGPGGRGSGGFGSGGNGTGTGGGNGSGSGPGEHGVGGGTGGGATHGGLNPEQIRRVVVAHRGALQACYEIEAQKDPTLRGGVTLTWTIDPGGAVTSASLAGSTIHNPRVEGCVLRQLRAWHFPSSDAPTQVASFPFTFGIGR